MNINTWSNAGRPPFEPSARGAAASRSARNSSKSTTWLSRSSSSPLAESCLRRSFNIKKPGLTPQPPTPSANPAASKHEFSTTARLSEVSNWRGRARLLKRLDGSVSGLFHRLETNPETRGRTLPIQIEPPTRGGQRAVDGSRACHACCRSMCWLSPLTTKTNSPSAGAGYPREGRRRYVRSPRAGDRAPMMS